MARLFRSLTAAVLTVALLAAPAQGAYYPGDKAHADVDYAQMSWESFDETQLTQALDQLESLTAILDNGAFPRSLLPVYQSYLQDAYQQLLDGYDTLYTQMTLAMLRYDADYTDEAAAQAYTERLDRLTVLFDRCLTALKALAKSPLNGILKENGGKDWADSLSHYEPMTEEELALCQQETQLVSEYEQLLGSDYDTQTMGELYLELVDVRTQLARLYGYRSYADYAYESVYCRDYAPKDVKAVQRTVKATFPQLLGQITQAIQEEVDALYDLPAASGQERLEAIAPYLGQIHPELEESFAFLLEHHLYDLDDSGTKLPMGYTAELPSYGSAFIFDSPYGDFRDYNTVVHEFGHFNSFFHGTDRALWADNILDVSEIQSQALELLFTAHSGDLFGRLGNAHRWHQVCSILGSVVDGYMYNEFETAVYAQPDMTVEELNSLFLSITQDYGYDDYAPEEWMEVTHLFQSPFYYVSYGTSALSALDIWLTSRTDWAGAVDSYMVISALPTTVTYEEAAGLAGLGDIFETATLEDLAQRLGKAMEEELGLSVPAMGRPRMDGSSSEKMDFLPILALCCCGAAFFAGVVALLLFVRRRRRRVEESEFSHWSSSRPKEDPWD